MKLIKILSHPYLLIASFCIVLISGEHLGGFYLLYLLVGIPFGAVHSFLGLGAIVSLLVAFSNRDRIKQKLVLHAVYIVSALLMMLSLFFFFYQDTDRYNYGTFYQLIPQIILIVFISIALFFITVNLKKALERNSVNNFSV